MEEINFNNKQLVFIDIETSSVKPDAEILEIAGLITDSDFNILEG